MNQVTVQTYAAAEWLCQRTARGCLRLAAWCRGHRAAAPAAGLRALAMEPAPSKWAMVRMLTEREMDFGEGECAGCGEIWEAGVPHGCRGALQCPRCGQFAGRFTCLVEGRKADKRKERL